MEIIKDALRKYDNGDEEAIYEIIKKMMPLIKKLSYMTSSFMEREDSIQEFCIAIIKAIPELERGRREGEHVKFLAEALNFKYRTLCNRQPRKHINIENTNELREKTETNILDAIELKQDILSYLKNLPDKQKKTGNIFKMFILDKMRMSDIAKDLHVSRQYVFKVVNEMIRDFSEKNGYL